MPWHIKEYLAYHMPCPQAKLGEYIISNSFWKDTWVHMLHLFKGESFIFGRDLMVSCCCYVGIVIVVFAIVFFENWV